MSELNLERVMLRESYMKLQRIYPDLLSVKMTEEDLKIASQIHLNITANIRDLQAVELSKMTRLKQISSKVFEKLASGI